MADRIEGPGAPDTSEPRTLRQHLRRTLEPGPLRDQLERIGAEYVDLDDPDVFAAAQRLNETRA